DKEVEENLGEKQSTGLVAGGVSESRFSGGDQNRSRESAENSESYKNKRRRRKIATGGKTANRERREQNDQTEKRDVGGDEESGEVENRVGRDQSDSGELPQFARSGNFQHSRHGGPEKADGERGEESLDHQVGVRQRGETGNRADEEKRPNQQGQETDRPAEQKERAKRIEPKLMPAARFPDAGFRLETDAV